MRLLLKTEEMKEGPGLHRTVGSLRLPLSTLTGVRGGGRARCSGVKSEGGQGRCRVSGRAGGAGRCGSASGPSRISLPLGLSWREREGARASGQSRCLDEGQRPGDPRVETAKWFSHPPARSGAPRLFAGPRVPEVAVWRFQI